MAKRFFYEFNGRVFLEANYQDEAEKAVIGISLDDYIIDEELYEVDQNYVAHDKKIREVQFGTNLHPFDDSEEYLEFKMKERRYGKIFNEFLHGKFDKNELMKRMAQAEKENLVDYAVIDEINMIDLKSKKLKGVRHCFVD